MRLGAHSAPLFPFCVCPFAATSAGNYEDAPRAAAQVHAALDLPADHRVHWVDLHDAVTTALTHGKAIPPGALLHSATCAAVFCMGMLLHATAHGLAGLR